MTDAAPVPADPAVHAAAPHRARRTVLHGIAAALILAAVAGWSVGDRYVWADRLFGHYLVWGLVAWLLEGCLLTGANRSRLRAIPLGVLTVTGAFGFLVLLAMNSLGEGSEPAVRSVSPGGQYAAVVTQERWGIDPLYRVTIEQTQACWPGGGSPGASTATSPRTPSRP